MAGEAIEWRGGDGSNEINPAGSGTPDTAGFFGAGGFGFSVRVGEYQDNCFATNSTGTVDSGQLPNLKFADTSGCYVANETSRTPLSGATGVQLSESTLRIRVTSSGNIQTQNSNFRAFDGSNINNNPNGVTVQAFELIGKPSGSGQISTDFNIYGSGLWKTIAGSGSVLPLRNQPFSSGTHDFYVGISCSPTSVGSKLFGFYMECEFI